MIGWLTVVTLTALSACNPPSSTCGPRSAVVVRAIDGDTVELDSGERVRYLLVDTPELHLASEDVVPFVAGLRSLGEDNQIIVATGSRELAAQVPSIAVIRLG